MSTARIADALLAAASRCGGFRPAPGRNTSTEPASARSARATASATCALDRRARVAAEIARLDREGAAFARRSPARRRAASATRAPSMVADITSSLQILAQALLRVARQREAEIGVERALVEFVEQHARRRPSSDGIVEDHAGEDAFGDHLDAGPARHLRAEAHAIADRVADLSRRASPPCARRRRARRAGAAPARGSCLPLRPRLVEQHQRHARGLAGAGRRDQHGADCAPSAAVSRGSAASIGSELSKVLIVSGVITRESG